MNEHEYLKDPTIQQWKRSRRAAWLAEQEAQRQMAYADQMILARLKELRKLPCLGSLTGKHGLPTPGAQCVNCGLTGVE